LFSRALDNDERLWRVGGSFAAIGAARALVLALVVVAGSIAGALPLWPVLVLIGLTGVAALAAMTTRNRTARTHIAHALDAFHAVETLAGIVFGLASVLFLAPFSSSGARRRTTFAVSAAACALLMGAFSATVLVDLV